jgi:glycerophosphoryl diester phosphodiesterase
LAPENTLASFHKALSHHVDQVEFDLRLTGDGVIVIHHDPFLTDPSGAKLTLNQHDYAELLRHKADLLSFDELLAAVDWQVRLLIEIKPQEPTEDIIKRLQAELAAGRPADTMAICSFDQTILRAMHTAFPELEMVVIERWSGVRAGFRARELGTRRLSMNARWLWSGFLKAMHKRGYQISPYTMNDPQRVRRWSPYLYGVITDYPDRFENQVQKQP